MDFEVGFYEYFEINVFGGFMRKSIVKWVVVVPTAICVFAVSCTLTFNLVRQLIVEQNEVLVHNVAQNLMPALLANDTEQVEAALKALEKHAGVESAELISAQGVSIASYARSGDFLNTGASSFELASSDGGPSQLHVMAPITFDSLIVANLHIAVNLWPIYLRLISWLGFLLIVPTFLYLLVKNQRLKLRFEVVNDSGQGSGGAGGSFDVKLAVNRAMKEAGVSIEYQPIHRLTDGGLLGVEVVVAWCHPSGQTLHISPSEFVALIEETDICLPFADWVLHEACAQAASWQQQYGPLILTLNLSEKQFADTSIPQKIRDICAAEAYPHQLLEIEVHESSLLKETSAAELCLKRFIAEGLTVTVDNFGLSRRSLEVLSELSVRKVRLDRKLVKSVAHDEQVSDLIALTVKHASALNIQVMIDGVESSNQCLALKRLGCGVAQGHYFSPPLSASEFTGLLKERSFASVTEKLNFSSPYSKNATSDCLVS